MSALPTGTAAAVSLAPVKLRARGFLHIVRHGAGPGAVYVLTYHRLESPVDTVGARHAVPVLGFGSSQGETRPKPAVAEGAQALIELLERIGINFALREVREALEDILRLGSANIPDLWLSDDEMLEKGLVES